MIEATTKSIPSRVRRIGGVLGVALAALAAGCVGPDVERTVELRPQPLPEASVRRAGGQLTVEAAALLEPLADGSWYVAWGVGPEASVALGVLDAERRLSVALDGLDVEPDGFERILVTVESEAEPAAPSERVRLRAEMPAEGNETAGGHAALEDVDLEAMGGTAHMRDGRMSMQLRGLPELPAGLSWSVWGLWPADEGDEGVMPMRCPGAGEEGGHGEAGGAEGEAGCWGMPARMGVPEDGALEAGTSHMAGMAFELLLTIEDEKGTEAISPVVVLRGAQRIPRVRAAAGHGGAH